VAAVSEPSVDGMLPLSWLLCSWRSLQAHAKPRRPSSLVSVCHAGGLQGTLGEEVAPARTFAYAEAVRGAHATQA
jgi:hypothetical protein